MTHAEPAAPATAIGLGPTGIVRRTVLVTGSTTETVPESMPGTQSCPYLVRLTAEGERLLRRARPRFRTFAEAVEARLGNERVGGLRDDLAELREAIEAQLNSG